MYLEDDFDELDAMMLLYGVRHRGATAVQEVDSTASAYLRVQVSNIDNGREAGEIVENEPVTDVLAMFLGSVSTSGGGSGNTVSSSVANSTEAVAVATQAPRQVVLPADLSRRSVIREGLLGQGFSELAVTEYFNQFTEGTNSGYDSMWRAWE
ncbi:hypothetical protein GGI19_004853, partial [Coemansia pectinata]